MAITRLPVPEGPDRSGPSAFDLEVWPHRSLGRCGSSALLAVVAIGLLAVVVRAPAAAIVPIGVGCAITFVATALAFHCNNRSARIVEKIRITPEKIHVERTGAAAKARSVEFTTYWARVETTDTRQVANRLVIRESGRSIFIGEFLSPEERAELAVELRRRIAEARDVHGTCNPA